jgi:hypothetical protein
MSDFGQVSVERLRQAALIYPPVTQSREDRPGARHDVAQLTIPRMAGIGVPMDTNGAQLLHI